MPHIFLLKLLPQRFHGAVNLTCSVGIPAIAGSAGGATGINLTEWRYPTITYFFISLIIQLGIEVIRSWFRERKERFDAAENMASRIEAHYEKILSTMAALSEKEKLQNQTYRHHFINVLNAMEGENKLLRTPGANPDSIPHVRASYPSFTEDEDEIHRSLSVERKRTDITGKP